MKIGILTSFGSMMDYYSLTSVVRTQLKMIKTAGHQPVLMAQSDFNWPEKPDWVEIRTPIPVHTKIDYANAANLSDDHKVLVGQIEKNLLEAVLDLDAILTHDLIFTGWNVPIGLAIQNAAKKSGPWFHWVHSVPGGARDYWKLPENSVLVYPNHTDQVRCAENFRTFPEKVVVIPHCCDVRDLHVKTELGERIISRYDLLGADLVQVYPIPTDRAEAKGIADVIRLFACFKRFGRKVRLIIPNAWCNVDQWRNKVDALMQFAHQQGLTRMEVVFTSQAYPEHEVGIPLNVISDLALCANVFVCPTQSETFGLSLAEAAMSGCLLILNEDLPMMREVVGGAGNAVWAKFSSSFMKTAHVDKDKYMKDIAKIALHVFDNSPSLKSTSHYRKAYRREAVWQSLEGAILAARAGRFAVSA